ncbi:hypothetical protein [Nocardia carnea]|uniref:hypothetical protein n=1 Tax=Nocardia carnea TaxID=37328 RepID=UPI0024561CCD|nr:hypothetical protein [Nocardia carnea]
MTAHSHQTGDRYDGRSQRIGESGGSVFVVQEVEETEGRAVIESVDENAPSR